MQVNEITPAEQKRTFEKVRPVRYENAATIDADAINVVVDTLKKHVAADSLSTAEGVSSTFCVYPSRHG